MVKKLIPLTKICAKNLLSFGTPGVELDLLPLNVLIGPNGSGKSNLIEVIGLLNNAPEDLAEPFRETGGIEEWIWKGAEKRASAEIEATVNVPRYEIGSSLRFPSNKQSQSEPLSHASLRYRIAFRSTNYQLVWMNELTIIRGNPHLISHLLQDATLHMKMDANSLT